MNQNTKVILFGAIMGSLVTSGIWADVLTVAHPTPATLEIQVPPGTAIYDNVVNGKKIEGMEPMISGNTFCRESDCSDPTSVNALEREKPQYEYITCYRHTTSTFIQAVPGYFEGQKEAELLREIKDCENTQPPTPVTISGAGVTSTVEVTNQQN